MKSAIPLLLMALSHGTAQQRPLIGPRIPAGRMSVGEASIEGRVVNELTRAPVKKAQVMLNGATNRTAVTGGSGNFAFKELPAGQYHLQATATDFSGLRPGFGLPRLSITVSADEHKADVVLSLVPGAAIAGRVVDEDGSPMANCSVSAMQWDYTQGTRMLRNRAGASSNDKGEYRIASLVPGKYYVLARCRVTVPLPHPFIRRGSDVEIPSQGYAPLFYPGALDLSGAAGVVAAAGGEVTGIDFCMSPAGGVTVRGHVTAASPQALPGNLQLVLEPRDPQRREWWLRAGAQFDRQSGDFRFQQVLPGSYEITAVTSLDGTFYHARVHINIGSAAPEPLELKLAPAVTLSGMISFDGEGKAPFENMRVMLNPLEHQFPFPQPQGQVQKDGSFVLPGVVPGRWRLVVSGAPGYVKSVSLNEEEVSPFSPGIPAGFAGPMRIVIGTKPAEVQGTVSGAPSETGQITGLLWPVEPERQQGGLERNFYADAQRRFRQDMMAPGRYYACAMALTEPWMLQRNVALLEALKTRCVTLELTEGGRTAAQVPFIPARELEQMAQDADNDAAPK